MLVSQLIGKGSHATKAQLSPKMRFSKARDPFKPGFGGLPPELAGRDPIKATLGIQLSRLRSKVPEVASLALIGPRGCGKTTLLSWLKSKAASSRVQVVQLQPSRVQSLADLASTFWNPGRHLTGRLRFGGNVTQEHVSAGASAEVEGSSKVVSESLNVPELLIAKARKKPLVLVIDEAHELKPEIAHVIFDSFQSVADMQPMLLLIAGTPDTSMHLQNAKVTFKERQRTFRIGRLDDESSFDALAKPLGAYGVDFDDSVVRRAAREAQNYPYLLQCWGKSLWDALPDKQHEPNGDPGRDWFSSLLPFQPRLGAEEFSAAKDNAVEASKSLYGERMLEFKRYRISSLVSELALQIVGGIDPGFAVQDFSNKLSNIWKLSGSPPPRNLPTDNLEHSAVQLLLHTGFVWETSQGSWDFGIPSLAGHTAKSVAKSIAVQMTMENGVPALHAVLDFASRTERTHDEIVSHLTSVGSVENLNHANVILDHLENDGILGPVGRRDSSGNALQKVLTPQLADAVIKSLDQMPRPELLPTHDLDALPFR